MSGRRQPFKSDYSGEGSNTSAHYSELERRASSMQSAVVSNEQSQTPSVETYLKPGSETPYTGKFLGADKPRRVKVRGKISK
jgi:hypothetical protein